MESGGGDDSVRDTTRDFLRSFSVIGADDSDESDFDELSPIPETPDNLDEIDEPDASDFTEGNRQHEALVKFVPYGSVFQTPIPFSDVRDNCWIPGQKVFVKITGFDRQAALKILNPNLYTIEVLHGDYAWTVHRRYKHFRQLHDHLALFRTKYRLHLHFPKRDLTERRRTIAADLKGIEKQRSAVRLPLRPEALVSEENIPQRMEQLQDYLQNLLKCKPYRNHPETLKFLEVSNMSFVNKLGIKTKEGMVEKCSGGRRLKIQCCGFLQNLHVFGTWNKRWLLIKDNFVAYIRPEDGHISDVMLMDAAFKVTHGLVKTGAKHGVLIENLSRKLLIKSWTSRKAKEWAESLDHVAKTKAQEYTRANRFGSFAPVREKEFARWFVDGRSYFEAVADALERAREEIYITDWWLSPQIYLKRPVMDGEKWRLDITLKRKADQGVKVFVLVYKEVEAALSLKSSYTKQVLMGLSPNIKVLRHPDHIRGTGVLLWAHHEKLVIIDQQIAFSGGLDLCYGRWDDHSHKMTDLGSVTLKSQAEGGGDIERTTLSVRVKQQLSGRTVNGDGDTPEVLVTPPTPAPDGIQHLTVRPDVHTEDVSKDVPRKTGVAKDGEKVNADCTTVRNEDELPTPTSQSSPCSNSAEESTMSRDSVNTDVHNNDNDLSVCDKTDVTVDSNASHACHDTQRQPIEANVLFETPKNRKSQSHTDEISPMEPSSPLDENVAENSGQEIAAAAGSPTIKYSGNHPLEKESESLDESEVQEIYRSMQPFKDLHTDESIDQCSNGIADAEDVNVGLDSTIDKEIICLADDESTELHNKGDKGKGKDSKKNNGDFRSIVKGSHLWTRRSNRKSLEVSIPEPTYRKTSANSAANTIPEVHNVSTPNTAQPKTERLTLIENDKLRASNSSTESRISEGEPLKKRSSNSQSDNNCSTPQTASSSTMGMGHAASAINALRKIMNRKEQNNNSDDAAREESPGAGSNSARKRWKLALNVSKFDNIMRTPQVPEQLDENVFYNWNVEKPRHGHKSKSAKIIKTLKGGVFKGERRNSTDFSYETKGNMPLIPESNTEDNIREFGLDGSTKLWIGKDYVNFIHKDFQYLEQPFEDFIDRTMTPRMPWHDIGSVVSGKAARDLARHFIGRWNATKLEKCKKNPNFPWLVPKSTTKCHTIAAFKDFSFEVRVQVLRSSCNWSAGIAETEQSIHEAYEHCIENARDYIYIENQFFITQVQQGKGAAPVSNCIGNALYKRILRAHRSGRSFKVYVVMPLLPAFEGEFGTSSGASLQTITHWNYASICRGGNSLMERLAKEIPDPNKYIVFCGLRTWDKLNDKLMTEIVYVHSKLMIVDDDTVIIGSANVNDRSMVGSRDSEIAVMFEDTQNVNVDVNGKKYTGGKFASALRWTLFREHLGLLTNIEDIDLTDISCDSFYKDIWLTRAAFNTKYYEKVFRCLPTDSVKTFNELRQYKTEPLMADTDPVEAEKWLAKIRGYLVLIPLQFLKDESLTPKVGQKEQLLPTHMWT